MTNESRIEEIDLQLAEMNSKLRRENKDNLDACLSMIKDICLNYDLRVGQLFETMRVLSTEKDLFNYSNERLKLTLEKEFICQ